MGRALWRELVVGFAYQLGELNLGFTQLAALYVLAEGSTTTVADLAEAIGRSPSATSRLVDGLVKRRLVERRREEDDGRLRSVWLTPARPGRAADGRPGPRRAVPGGGAADAARRAGAHRDGGRGARDARDQPARPARPRRELSAGRDGRMLRAHNRDGTSDITRTPMDQHRFLEFQYRIEHRHNDGSWAEMAEQRQPHDAADARPRALLGRPSPVPLQDLRRGADDRPWRAGLRPATRPTGGQPQKAATTSYRTGRPQPSASSPTRSSTPWNRSRNRSPGSRRSGEKP